MRTQNSSEVLSGSHENVAGFRTENEACGRIMPMPARTLTPAEKRVLDLVSHAKTNKEIAHVLGISPATVKRHLENLLRKLQLKNRVEAAIYALVIAGCPRGMDRNCPLASWHRNLADNFGPFDR